MLAWLQRVIGSISTSVRTAIGAALRWIRRGVSRTWTRTGATRAAAFGAILSAVLVVFVFPWLQELDDPPSRRSQLAEIRSKAAEQHRFTRKDQGIDLQNSGPGSHLFVFRHQSQRVILGRNQPYRPVSDEIRIYTTDSDGELHAAFRFQPKTVDTPTLFEVEEIEDLDGNDRNELVGAFYTQAMTPIEPIPAIIAWDDRQREYRLTALMRNAPRLRQISRPGLFANIKRRKYGRGVTLKDSRSHARVVGHRAEGFALTETRFGQPGLLTAFVARAPSAAEPQSVEIALWLVDYQGPVPRVIQCSVYRRSATGTFPPPPTLIVDSGPQFGAVGGYSRWLEANGERIAARFTC